MRKRLIVGVMLSALLCGGALFVTVHGQTQQCGGSFVPSMNCLISGYWNYTHTDATSALPLPFRVAGADASGVVSACKNLANADVLALKNTPFTLIAAPGPGKWIDVIGADLAFKYTAAYTSVQNQRLWYTSRLAGAAASAAITASGLLDATANTVQRVAGTTDNTNPTTNAAVVIEQVNPTAMGGGDAANVLQVCVNYRIVVTPF